MERVEADVEGEVRHEVIDDLELEANSGGSSEIDYTPAGSDEEENSEEPAPPSPPLPGLGCEHYRRKCQLVCPEESCGKIFTCRFCHDEAVPSHTLDRYAVKEVVCMVCNERQPAGITCVNESCDTIFGKYNCQVCHLYNDEDKKTFHCDGCGLCRVGPQENFFHCATCDMCFPVKLQGKHKCVEKASRGDCAVCLEDIHAARCPSHIPPCGHLIHQPCFEQMLKKAMYTCPLCNASMVDMERVWKHLDEQIQISPLPVEYSNKNVEILCRDCNKFSTVLFHFIGLKCAHCGSFNTSLESGLNLNPNPGNAEGENLANAEELQAEDDEEDEEGGYDEDQDVFEDAEEIHLDEIVADYAEFVDSNDIPSTENIEAQLNEFFVEASDVVVSEPVVMNQNQSSDDADDEMTE